MDQHLDVYGLMEAEQRGAKEGCSGTTDNLLIERMVTQDCHRGRRNLSMAWVDVTKAYGSVDHEWLSETMSIHRFPRLLARVVTKLSKAWNTRIVTRTKLGMEMSETIQFRRGLPQGDSLCPRLFTHPIPSLGNSRQLKDIDSRSRLILKWRICCTSTILWSSLPPHLSLIPWWNHQDLQCKMSASTGIRRSALLYTSREEWG